MHIVVPVVAHVRLKADATNAVHPRSPFEIPSSNTASTTASTNPKLQVGVLRVEAARAREIPSSNTASMTAVISLAHSIQTFE